MVPIGALGLGYLAIVLAQANPTPSPTAIFLQAQQNWLARTVPPYESFRIACDRTFLAPGCDPGDMVLFIVRTSDGRTYAQSQPVNGGLAKPLLRGGHITGPAGTPLGFYRALPSDGAPPQPPPNLAPDPFHTIATVIADAHAYDITLTGEATVAGRRCYHLALRPVRDAERYPLRELWVEASSFEVVQLVYELPYDERHSWARVLYRFAPVGTAGVWTIVHIEAQAKVRGLLAGKTERVDDDLSDISFPATVPDAYFEPAPATAPP